MSAEPSPLRMTLPTGQPILMSRMSAPEYASAMGAASAMTSGLVAEDLHGGGVLVWRRPEQLLRFFIVIDQRLGAHHFRAGEGGALRAAQRAKRRIGHARHGRERERAADLDVSDLHHAISSSTGQWSLP